MSHPYLKSTKGLQDLAPPHSPSLISQHIQTLLTPNTHPMPYDQGNTSKRLSYFKTSCTFFSCVSLFIVYSFSPFFINILLIHKDTT